MLIWQEVQFILWLMCVASNAAEISRRDVIPIAPFVQSCYPVYHYLERNVYLPEDKETNTNIDPSFNLTSDWFIFASKLSLHLCFKVLLPLLHIYFIFAMFLFYFVFWHPTFVTVFVFTRCCIFSMCSYFFLIVFLIDLIFFFLIDCWLLCFIV